MSTSLQSAHHEGQHSDAVTGVVDPSGYWRDAGCTECVSHYRNRPFELVTRHDIGNVIVFIIKQKRTHKEPFPGNWTVVVCDQHPEQDAVIGPDGHNYGAGHNPSAKRHIPHSVWDCLTEALKNG